jgi:hypothetical protein
MHAALWLGLCLAGGAHLGIGFAAADVRAAVIEDSGHWIMEEQPEQGGDHHPLVPQGECVQA